MHEDDFLEEALKLEAYSLQILQIPVENEREKKVEEKRDEWVEGLEEVAVDCDDGYEEEVEEVIEQELEGEERVGYEKGVGNDRMTPDQCRRKSLGKSNKESISFP